MKRSDFLKGIGLAAGAAVLPNEKARAAARTFKLALDAPPACTLIPTETAGPFPLDLTANTFYFRKDIREISTGVYKTGAPLNVKLKIIGDGNCLPMQNCRVNVWHCDKDGLYSGYDQTNNAGQAGQTYLRGYQMTDANGIVEFTTIFPGWYTGRICHIHFQVWVSSAYAAISQLTFPIAEKNALYAANALYTKGADPMTLAQDNIFSDGYNLQLATLTPNATTGGYDTYLEVTIKGSGVLATIEPETGGLFRLGQNFPNPFDGRTAVPFTLTERADVRLELVDLQGNKVAEIPAGNLPSGDHKLEVDLKSLGLPLANYAYQISVSNEKGLFKQAKLMTAM